MKAFKIMNIVILGQQGSGKGTQAELIAQKFDLEHIDMGKFLREVAKQNTPLGKEIYKIQNIKNSLVPSRVLREILAIKLASIPKKNGIIFDGVPRTVDQVQYLEEELLNQGRKIDKVFLISIPKEESIRRISRRRVCGNCETVLIMGKDVKNEEDKCPRCGSKISHREDDTEKGIQKRLELFERETRPVIDYYRKKNILLEINGEKTVDSVFREIEKNMRQ
jgi:adenylate kinase